jgi:hypothetical protein
VTADAGPDPHNAVLDASRYHQDDEDGYGHRVHVPLFDTAVRRSTWGSIKKLFREWGYPP